MQGEKWVCSLLVKRQRRGGVGGDLRPLKADAAGKDQNAEHQAGGITAEASSAQREEREEADLAKRASRRSSEGLKRERGELGSGKSCPTAGGHSAPEREKRNLDAEHSSSQHPRNPPIKDQSSPERRHRRKKKKRGMGKQEIPLPAGAKSRVSPGREVNTFGEGETLQNIPADEKKKAGNRLEEGKRGR